MKYAFCTLLSSKDYLGAVLILNRSIQKSNSKYPLVVMLTENLKEDKGIIASLQENGIFIEIVPVLSYSPITMMEWKDHPVLNTASKLNILNLRNWDKLVYLDADMALMENCDELFLYKDGSMGYDDEHIGFSGIFVIEPKYHHEFKFMKAAMEHIDCFDGNLFADCWFHVISNPATYGISHLYFERVDKNYRGSKNAKIMHLSHDIPLWNFTSPLLDEFTDYPFDYYKSLMD